MSATGGTRYDSIVVGGGHNGLVCAAYLARSGRSVLVLEAASQVGGAAVTREFAPGFKVSACAHLLHLMPPALMRELDLETLGLRLAAADLPSTALASDGAHLSLGAGASAALGAHSPADAGAYADWQSLLSRLATALHPVLSATPPRLGTEAWRDQAPAEGGASCGSCCVSVACACTTCSRTASACHSSKGRWHSMRCSARTTGHARPAPC